MCEQARDRPHEASVSLGRLPTPCAGRDASRPGALGLEWRMPCELYLVRHAIAAERGDEWPDDTKRPLTERGISRFKEVVRGLKASTSSIDEIFTSPLVRARQTADLLAAGIDGKATVKMLDALAPGHTPAAVMAQLAKAAKRHRIALVGHEPDLGELAAHLIGAQRALPFKKGGICRIDLGRSRRVAPVPSSGFFHRKCSDRSPVDERQHSDGGHHQPDFGHRRPAGRGASARRAGRRVSGGARCRRGDVRHRTRRTRARAGRGDDWPRRVAVRGLGRRRHGERSRLGAGVHATRTTGHHSQWFRQRARARARHSARPGRSLRAAPWTDRHA